MYERKIFIMGLNKIIVFISTFIDTFIINKSFMSILTLLKRSDIVESMYEIFVKNIFLRIGSVNFGRNEKALI